MTDNPSETRRFSNAAIRPEPVVADEVLITDSRAGLTPAQHVEQKLVSLLERASLPFNRMHATPPRRTLS